MKKILFACIMTSYLIPAYSQVDFIQHTIPIYVDRPKRVCAADFNGDGNTDILSGCIYGNRNGLNLVWHENSGNGAELINHTITTTTDTVTDVFAIDIDGDGDTDVLTSSRADDKISLYENNGSGTFSEFVIDKEVPLAKAVHAADLDGDGDVDVLGLGSSSTYYVKTLFWFENDGSEKFTPHSLHSGGTAGKNIVTADLDGDGDLDVICSVESDSLCWFENKGGSPVKFSANITEGAGVHSVCTGDIDGDGAQDIISASLTNGIAWHRNVGGSPPSFTFHCFHRGVLSPKQAASQRFGTFNVVS